MSIKAAASQQQLLPSLSTYSNVSVPLLLKSSSVFYDKRRGLRFDSLRCQSSSASTAVSKDLSTQVGNGFPESNAVERNVVRLGLPSKGRMATDTLDLLKDCQLAVRQVNPRQYVADIPGLSNLEVWFQRPKDVVRKLLTGDLDLGIVGIDTVSEFGQGNEDLIFVHDALEYGECRLSIAIPKYGIFQNISSMDELAAMPEWTENRPLRITTGFTYLGPKFVKEKGLKHVKFSTADGALEAAPAMGIADAILDLVSSGTTLRENNLKEIKGVFPVGAASGTQVSSPSS